LCGFPTKESSCTNSLCQNYENPVVTSHKIQEHKKHQWLSTNSKKTAFLLLFGSFVWLIGVLLLLEAVDAPSKGHVGRAITSVLLFGFVGIFLAGAGIWARAKEYPAILGVLLAFFCSGLGLLILALLPDRSINPVHLYGASSRDDSS